MLTALQVLISIILIALVMIQETSGPSSLFGGGNNASYQTRRGAEKLIFTSTIVTGIIFFLLAIARFIF